MDMDIPQPPGMCPVASHYSQPGIAEGSPAEGSPAEGGGFCLVHPLTALL